MAFMGHYLELAQDKLGSRVADTIWDKAADGFTRVRCSVYRCRYFSVDPSCFGFYRKRSLAPSSTTTAHYRNRNTEGTLQRS